MEPGGSTAISLGSTRLKYHALVLLLFMQIIHIGLVALSLVGQSKKSLYFRANTDNNLDNKTQVTAFIFVIVNDLILSQWKLTNKQDISAMGSLQENAS